MNRTINEILNAETPQFSSLIDALAQDLPLLQDLANTPQEAAWHAEGNVANHCKLVLKEARHLARKANLSESQRLILLLAAILHDIGKVLTTRLEPDETGTIRLRSRGHARRGRDYLSYRLLSVLPAEQVEQLLPLIAEHHSLHRALDDHLQRGVWALARRANLPLLLLLAKADVRGRILGQQEQSQARHTEDMVELIELVAQDEGIWQQTDPYAEFRQHIATLLPNAPTELYTLACERGIRDWESGLIHTPHEAVARVQAVARDGFPRLTVLFGPSGSGKSSYANTLRNTAPNVQVISLDHLRQQIGQNANDQKVNGQVMQAARQALREGLHKKRHVIWDATSLRRSQRAQIIGIGHDYGALSEIRVLWATPQELTKRNARRERVVPHAVINHQLKILQFPERQEAHLLNFSHIF